MTNFPKEQCIYLIDHVSLRALCACFENYVIAVALGREGATTQSGRYMCNVSQAVTQSELDRTIFYQFFFLPQLL